MMICRLFVGRAGFDLDIFGVKQRISLNPPLQIFVGDLGGEKGWGL
jgi:hypothetical protein